MAADDAKGKKRKGASDSAPTAKKPRKSDEVTPAAKPTKARASRKQAADFFSDNDDAPAAEPAPAPAKAKASKKKAKAPAAAEAPVVEEPEVEQKPKKAGKKSKAAPVEEAPTVESPPKETTKKAAKSKKAAAPVEEPVAEVADEVPAKKSKKTKSSKKQPELEADEIELDADEDDQTAALLAGFESEGDDEDPDEDVDFDQKKLNGKGFALSKEDKAIMAYAEKHSTETGVVYVGRIPRGFFESQMKQYFSQFGRVRNLRLARNKKSGASKHYAFVEFASPEVADIVARTMNNYLLFGHILKCRVIPNEQVHSELFKGAGERFKVDPRNKKAGLEMQRGVEREQWDKRVEKENKRRSDKAQALKDDFGYEFQAPQAKSTKHVPKQLQNGQAQPALEDVPAETQAIEEPKPKKGKKGAKAKAAPETSAEAETTAVEEPEVEKRTRSKKRKSDVAPEEVDEVPAVETAPKGKKAKKDSNPAAAEEAVPEKKRKAKPEAEPAKPKKAKKAKA